ncbi:uncharacterized protein N7473_008301 [Penicillium subrubescens]|uniref:Uncharacterized protein n=1 Tax=Penicillium subrubescens TaxID=1316194 RepID=A0A1Q5TH59_9EURO|nr:uncharacterized protein N7473_008301 [Penicillium subrubescens]KAJ5892073.1 hypothetical protein N7473_008301 [Penicillium subrubescens]OKO99550.1 hypothetical protein PENSUB_8395 [Penicillium subrubescens]
MPTDSVRLAMTAMDLTAPHWWRPHQSTDPEGLWIRERHVGQPVSNKKRYLRLPVQPMTQGDIHDAPVGMLRFHLMGSYVRWDLAGVQYYWM